ncbi:LysR substrate-binding domain-containing protein [Aquibium microcysteis]|uniref:LysR substrate-binding domain-containing protein n=1 Tax=Aquibium microcysteis TaxID=675281 RepID=UPI00165CF0C7|nr:flavin reductase [Aquibium microcysteis]
MDADLRNRFLEGMSRVASAVTVVTTDGEAGRFGVTVSSMTSVSADTPRPSLLISIHHLSPACEAIRRNRRFCANVLSGSQSFLSDLFSGRLKHLNEDRFGAIKWHPGSTGAPIVDGAVVALDCELKTAVMWGTHFIFIGEVEQIELSTQRSPLVYANRGYRRAIPIAPEDHPPLVSADRLRVGFFITLGPELVPALFADFARREPGVDLRLLEADHDDLVEQMRADGIDAAITFGSVDDPDLAVELLCPPDPHVLVGEEHPLAGRSSLRLADLSDKPMILFDHPSVRRANAALFERGGQKPAIRLQSPSFAMVRGLVGRGLGYSVVPQRPRSKTGPDGGIIHAIPLREEFPEAGVIALARPAERHKPLVENFLAGCRAHFARSQ